MITPYSHLKNIPIPIIFPEEVNPGDNIAKVFINNFDANEMLLYSGKRLTLEHQNFDSPLEVMFLIATNGDLYVMFINGLDDVILANTTVISNTSFKVENDNEAITEADLISKFSSQQENFEMFEIEFVGTPGLLSPENYTKLKQLSNNKLFNIEITYENQNTYQFLGLVKVEHSTSLFTHKFGIVGEYLNQSWEISFQENSGDNLFIRTLSVGAKNHYSTTLRISNVMDVNSETYILIEALLKSDSSEALDTPFHQIWHNVILTDSVKISDSTIQSINFQYSTLSKEPGTYNTRIYTFLFDKYVQSYNHASAVVVSPREIQIANNTNLNTLLSNATYFGLQSQIAGITNKPDGLTRSFRIEIRPLQYIQSGYLVLQTLQTYDNANKIVIFNRLVSNSFVTDWTNIDNHKVPAANVDTTTEKMFVTQNQINAWNATANLVWKAPVTNISELSVNYPEATPGTASYVINVNMVYLFNGVGWEAIVKNVSETSNGIITASMYNEFFLQPGHSKKLTTKDNTYLHRLSVLSAEQKEFYSDNVLDLVSRTSLTKQIEQETIAIGFGTTTAYGRNSITLGKNVIANSLRSILLGLDTESSFNNTIGIGTGLRFTDVSSTFLGQYNLGDIVNAFEIGNGTSNTARSNLFAIRRDGVIVLNGFEIPGATANDILIANGTYLNIQALVDQVLEGVASTVTLYKEVQPTDQVNGKYTMEWTETQINLYGRMGKFEVWVKDDVSGKFSKQEVPIEATLIAEEDVDDPTHNNYTATEYVFDLSGLLSIIIVK